MVFAWCSHPYIYVYICVHLYIYIYILMWHVYVFNMYTHAEVIFATNVYAYIIGGRKKTFGPFRIAECAQVCIRTASVYRFRQVCAHVRGGRWVCTHWRGGTLGVHTRPRGTLARLCILSPLAFVPCGAVFLPLPIAATLHHGMYAVSVTGSLVRCTHLS